MKNILFIMHSMPIGGAEKVIVDLFDNFDYEKYSITLLLYTNEGAMLPRVNKHVKIRYLFTPQKRNIPNRVYSKLLSVLHLRSLRERAYVKRLKLPRYDCIISFCQGPAHKIHTFLLNNAPLHLTWVHSDLSKENWGKLFFDNNLSKQESAYNLMDKIIFVSEGAKATFNQTFQIDKRVRQEVIYNIVDVEDIRRRSQDFIVEKPNDKFLFVNSGRLVSQKKQVRLAAAAERLKHLGQKFEIWILGEGPLRGEIQEEITKRNVGDCVRLLGSQANPYPYVNAADAFVLTSSQEGFSIVVCEALVLGKAIVCTKVVGPTELLGGGKYGILVDEDIDSIVEGMRLMIEDKICREKFADLAHQRSLMFDKSVTMRQVYAALE